jgi:hypothetical membrane protein
MTQQTTPADTPTTTHQTCSPQDRVTKSLLGYGVIAGPCYVAVSLVQAFTRDGFDLGRHEWSLLANGAHGWIQIANFVLTGLMVIAFAVGLRRALASGATTPVGARWAPRLIAAYGVGLIAAGIFRADPALGFPVGTPETTPVSWHGMLHFVAAAVGFICLAIACFILARRYAAEHRQGWAIGSRLAGVLFLAGFVTVAAGGGARAANLAFTAAVILIWTWMAAVAAERYGYVACQANTPAT